MADLRPQESAEIKTLTLTKKIARSTNGALIYVLLDDGAECGGLGLGLDAQRPLALA